MNALVSISIVTWNHEDTIGECINSVLAQEYENIEILIFDNNSSDKTYELLQKLSDKRIKIQKNELNEGFCGGHNRNLKKTNGEFILLVNPDCILNKDYISKAIKIFEMSQSIGTVCGLLIQKDEENPIIDSTGLELSIDRRCKLRYNGSRLSDVNLSLQEIFGADGALPMYRSQMIKSISIDDKFFDEMFFAHKEDWDISWRARNFGWKTYFTPHAVAIHPRNFQSKNIAVRKKVSSFIKFHAVKNQFILLIKNEKISGFILHLPFILYRQFLIFIYILFFEQSSLKAYLFIIKNLNIIIKNRQTILKKMNHINSVLINRM